MSKIFLLVGNAGLRSKSVDVFCSDYNSREILSQQKIAEAAQDLTGKPPNLSQNFFGRGGKSDSVVEAVEALHNSAQKIFGGKSDSFVEAVEALHNSAQKNFRRQE